METNRSNRKAPKGKARASGQGGWVHVVDALPAHLVRMARLAANDGAVHSAGLLARKPANTLPKIDLVCEVCLSSGRMRIAVRDLIAFIGMLGCENPYFVFGDDGLNVHCEVHGLISLGAYFGEKVKQFRAYGIGWVYYLSVGDVADSGLAAFAVRPDLYLADTTSHDGSYNGAEINTSVIASKGLIGGVVLHRALGSPIANILEIKPNKPFVLVALRCIGRASLNEGSLCSNAPSDTFDYVVLDQLNTKTCDTISVRCDTSNGVNRSAHLDVAIGEMADIERFHLGFLLSSALGLLHPCSVPAVPHLKHLLPSRWNTTIRQLPVAYGALADTQFLCELSYTAFYLDRDFKNLHTTTISRSWESTNTFLSRS